MRTLVLYYSNTGNTQKCAEALAQQLGAELGEITCGAYLRWYGPLAMAWDIFTRHRPRVDVLTPPGAHYDLTVIGGPVWAARAARPAGARIRAPRRSLRSPRWPPSSPAAPSRPVSSARQRSARASIMTPSPPLPRHSAPSLLDSHQSPLAAAG